MRLETERLRLRPLDQDDAQDTFALDHDEGVNEYTGDSPSETLEAEREWLRSCPPRLAVIDKATEQFVGWCGLSGNELGYRLRRAWWGRGIATEAARACIDHAFANGVARVVASVHPQNVRSQRVLEKLGFERVNAEWWALSRS